MTDKLFYHATLSKQAFQKLSQFIEKNLGIKMPENKQVMLESRLQKRLKKLDYSSFEKYLEYLFSSEGMINEYPRLIDAVTTNKTDFFREPKHFDFLVENVLGVGLFRQKKHLRLWSAASSTGEEPYTLALVMEEYCRNHSGQTYSILATDISEEVLQTALTAVYQAEKLVPVPKQLLSRYFLRSKDKSKALYRIKPAIRSKIIFRQLNLLDSYTLDQKMDIVFCRNVLIYFDRAKQKQVLTRIIENMHDDGILFLGHSETLAGMDINLKSIGATVYKKGG
ncbi:MAG: chemotaxis protein CheR [Spirochaetales bacterium]|nr:chemotaxis protein CheR [Spirochaetales bacterium]